MQERSSMTYQLQDVKPYTAIATTAASRRVATIETEARFSIDDVAPLVGMSPAFVRKVLGGRDTVTPDDVLLLLDQDAFSETFVPRSKVLEHLIKRSQSPVAAERIERNGFHLGCARDLVQTVPLRSVQTVITSTPYWAMRIYDEMVPTLWADGELCPYGLEQTPEGFIRHSVEMLYHILPILKTDGSVWWNVGDTYSTRTQIRGNAVEALRAMQGKDSKGWHDHACRRYSAGHSYIKDGEQCLIPSRIAERASRIGYFLKSAISWVKTASLPEPQQSRVSRNVETILHLTTQRTPKFHRESYHTLAPSLGGRNQWETGKLSDAWTLPTSSGRGGHGAQFPLALPGRCIALSSDPGDLVLDPFMGSGTTAVAAQRLGRSWLGFDVSQTYLDYAQQQLDSEIPALFI